MEGSSAALGREPPRELIEESASGDSDGAREPPRDLVEEFGKAPENTGKIAEDLAESREPSRELIDEFKESIDQLEGSSAALGREPPRELIEQFND